MKLRAFAVIAALAAPGLASATPADSPPTNTPTNNTPTNNTPNNRPTPTPDTPSGGADRGAQPTTAGDPNKTGDTSKTPADTSKTAGDASKTAGDTGKTAGDTKGAKLNDADTKVVAHLHHVNQMEITLAKQAQKVGTARVKDYANTILTDHQSQDKDLTAFAKMHKVAAIPADKPMTDAERQDEKDMTAAMARIKTLKGADFDREYLTMMVSDHDKELTKIDVAISAVGDADLKTMLQGVKPVLQRHADQARDLQKSPQASATEPTKLPSTTK